MGARVITKVFHVTYLSECSWRNGSASKNIILVSVVFKTIGDKLPLSHLRINFHAHFNLEGCISSFQRLTSDPAHLFLFLYYIPTFYTPSVIPPHTDTSSNSSRREVDANFTLVTTNKKEFSRSWSWGGKDQQATHYLWVIYASTFMPISILEGLFQAFQG